MANLFAESYEAGTGSVQTLTNCSVARSSDFADVGSFSLKVTSTASGDVSFYLGANTMVAVSPSSTYTFRHKMRAASSARTIRSTIDWYQADGTTFISNQDVDVADASGSFNAHVVASATSPSNAGFARLRVQIFSTGAGGEIHYHDAAAFNTGADTSYPSAGSVSKPSNIIPVINQVAVQRAAWQ